VGPSLDRVVLEWEGTPPAARRQARFLLADVLLEIDADDPALVEELASLLGRPRDLLPEGPFHARFEASVRAHGGPARFGHLKLGPPAPDALSPAELTMGLGFPDFPFERVEGAPAWTNLAFRGERAPMFALRGEHCLFALVPGWRKAVSLLLLQRLMRLRQDAIFFHAATVEVYGAGVMLVGPKGAGKSTLALALATRGHGFLGDEHACYLPARGELVPFPRPLGVKPGPRARTAQQALDRAGRDPEREGMMRVPAEDLLTQPAPGPVPLRAVVFLRGFGEAAQLLPVEPGREELAALQPVGSSFANAASTERVFQLVRMLSATRVFHLRAGSPDDTAALLESALRS
jgi:HPr serine kinase-like protein